jgi:NRPS condensation-like uncharacterized protein
MNCDLIARDRCDGPAKWPVPVAETPHSRAYPTGRRLPLTITEELFFEIERQAGPSNMQFEVRVAGALDEARLGAALAAAVALHPMTRLRFAAERFLFRRPQWEIMEPVATQTFAVARVHDDPAMTELRDQFFNEPIDVSAGPPLRVLLARRAGGDSVLFSIHHAIADGIGGIRFVNSVSRAYAGKADPVPDVDPLVVRDFRALLGRTAVPNRPDGSLRDHFRKFVAVRPRGASCAPVSGICTTILPIEKCRRLDPRRFGPDATLNDLLIAALHLTVASWNATLGAPADGIAVLVPINLRPAAWNSEVVANLIMVDRNVTTAAQRTSLESLVAAVLTQTNPMKSGAAFSTLMSRPDWLFWLITRVYTPFTLQIGRLSPLRIDERSRSKGHWLTLPCANLGRVERKIAGFGGEAGELTEFWASPPSPMPIGVGMTTIILHGRIHIGLRYDCRLFDARAAADFSGLFVEHLTALGNGSQAG